MPSCLKEIMRSFCGSAANTNCRGNGVCSLQHLTCTLFLGICWIFGSLAESVMCVFISSQENQVFPVVLHKVLFGGVLNVGK